MRRQKEKYIPALRYDWLTRLYDPVLRLTMPEKKFKTALVEQASILPDAKLLDFGCGSLTLTLIAKEAHPSSVIYAVDVDKKILKVAEKKLEKSEEEIHVQLYDGRTLPYSNDQFDRVISSLVFHHLNRTQKIESLQEIYRVLKPEGELHIADWGKAKNRLLRTAFYAVQLLDGFKTTNDNVNGLLPEYIQLAGFKNVTETKTFQTIFGTLSLYKAIKSKALSRL